MPTPYRLTITASDMREINRSAIIEILRRESPISRTAISKELDVSLPTVMRIVDELAADGLVRPQGSTEWSGGRRRPLLEFNADGFVVIGVDMSGSKFYGAASDLGGRVLDEIDMGRHGRTGEGNYNRLIELIDALLASPSVGNRNVRGIGVGAPGITLHQEGVVKWAYTLDWRDFPLKARLTEHYGLPITVDNDVNLIACGKGIGAGIIIDGALYRGGSEASGEIGAFIPGREFLGRDFADFGALESVASGTGVLNRARADLRSSRTRTELDALTEEQVFRAARQGQLWATSIVDQTVDYLAIAIANLAVSFDPELIVLGGDISPFADLFVEPILRRLEGAIPTLPRLVGSPLGLRAGVMGAITNVLHTTSNFYVVHKLS
jgi:predicted NBD/HSP70 family sugar kinase